MCRWAWIGLVAAGCASETEVGDVLPEFGPANPQDLETPSHSDRIVQVTIPRVDALFVVDNSCSMEEEQVALGLNFPGFLTWFLGSGLDYHIGVVSTDMKDPEHTGKLREVSGVRWVAESTESPESIFSLMAGMGTTGSATEAGRAAAYTALEVHQDGFNEGFAREQSGLHITVVSDEDDDSGDSPVSRAEWIDYLQNARWNQRMVSFSSIVGPIAGCPYIGEPGSDYMAVTGQVGGVTWPICTDDWSGVLEELGFLATGLSREFHLSQLPVPGSLEVSVETQGITRSFFEGEDWTYDGPRNSITFLDLVPDPLAVVTIEYLVLAGLEDSDDVEEPPEE